MPTLVIDGDSDAAVSFEVPRKRTADSVSGAEPAPIEDAPHGLGVRHAWASNRRLLAFLERWPSSPLTTFIKQARGFPIIPR